MAQTTTKNAAVKALRTVMANGKKHSSRTLLEYELTFNTNANRGKIYNQTDINRLYARDDWHAANGASKTCHLQNHLGQDFKYIVIKRHQDGGYIPRAAAEHSKCTGNQLIDEINCWLEYAETPIADLLCPILKYYTSKSDKVSATSEKMQANVVIIAQRAVYVGNADKACREAERLNADNGFAGETAQRRYRKLEQLSNEQGWRDAMYNRGNSGVIFDYSKNCYKAVFIDYAL